MTAIKEAGIIQRQMLQLETPQHQIHQHLVLKQQQIAPQQQILQHQPISWQTHQPSLSRQIAQNPLPVM